MKAIRIIHLFFSLSFSILGFAQELDVPSFWFRNEDMILLNSNATPNADVGLRLRVDDGPGSRNWSIFHEHDDNNLYFSYSQNWGSQNSDIGSIIMKMQTDGNVFLNSGTAGNSGKIVFKTADNSDESKFIGTENYWTVFGANVNEGWRFKNSNNSTIMQVNGGNGRIGIGTTNPSVQFQIKEPLSTGESVEFYMGDHAPGCCGTNQITSDLYRGVTIRWDNDYAMFGLKKYGNNRHDVIINNEEQNDNIRLQIGGLDRMVVYGNGDVVIGNIPPALNAKLTVDGKIAAKGIIVKPNGFADYVFNQDYVLKPLDEVESYIQKNHKLPNLPSEKEVVEKGLDVGDLQVLHTEKIEELTLYTIEQEKKLKEQEKQLLLQQKEIEGLKFLMQQVLNK